MHFGTVGPVWPVQANEVVAFAALAVRLHVGEENALLPIIGPHQPPVVVIDDDPVDGAVRGFRSYERRQDDARILHVLPDVQDDVLHLLVSEVNVLAPVRIVRSSVDDDHVRFVGDRSLEVAADVGEDCARSAFVVLSKFVSRRKQCEIFSAGDWEMEISGRSLGDWQHNNLSYIILQVVSVLLGPDHVHGPSVIPKSHTDPFSQPAGWVNDEEVTEREIDKPGMLGRPHAAHDRGAKRQDTQLDLVLLSGLDHGWKVSKWVRVILGGEEAISRRYLLPRESGCQAP